MQCPFPNGHTSTRSGLGVTVMAKANDFIVTSRLVLHVTVQANRCVTTVPPTYRAGKTRLFILRVVIKHR